MQDVVKVAHKGARSADKRARIAAGGVSGIERAMEAQRAAIALAVAQGDVIEERARVRSLLDMERRARSIETARESMRAETIQDAFRVYREAAQHRGRVDWLAKMGMAENSVLSRSHIAAAQILRDHVRGGGGLVGCEMQERVDGGSISNGQMERLTDARRQGRYALNAACDAVEPQKILRGVLMVILDGQSLRTAATACELSHGKALGIIRDGVVDALDAAVAYLGITRGGNPA
jgi:hypothetical protein